MMSNFFWKEILMYKRRKNRQKSLLCASNPYLHSHCASLFMTHWGPFSGVIAGAGPLKWEQQPRYMQPCQAPRVSLGQLETRGTLDRDKWPGLTLNLTVLWFSRALKLLKPWKFWEYFISPLRQLTWTVWWPLILSTDTSYQGNRRTARQSNYVACSPRGSPLFYCRAKERYRDWIVNKKWTTSSIYN